MQLFPPTEKKLHPNPNPAVTGRDIYDTRIVGPYLCHHLHIKLSAEFKIINSKPVHPSKLDLSPPVTY